MEIHEWTIARAFARREFSYSCFSWAKTNEIVFLSICHKEMDNKNRNTRRGDMDIHEEMILFYRVTGIALALTSEYMYHLDHPTKGLGILMLHELKKRVEDYNRKLRNSCIFHMQYFST